MRLYLDPDLSVGDLRTTEAERLTRSWARFDASGTRRRLLTAGGFMGSKIVPFLTAPMDVQWAYVDATPKLWNEARARGLLRNAGNGTQYMLVRRRAPRLDDGAPFLPATCLGEEHTLHKDAYFIPFRLSGAVGGDDVLFESVPPVANLSTHARQYLAHLGIAEYDEDFEAVLWWHALAIGYSPRYVSDNAGGIAADWPRIPLPATARALRTSAQLGSQLAQLLDPLRPLPAGLATVVGSIRRVGGGAANPGRGHLRVSAQWGILQRGGAVMPGRGKLVRRAFSQAERVALGSLVDDLGQACDIYLNEETFWSGVPERVWDFKVGGFQVLKKWLSYREEGSGQPGLLGRSLTVDEAREFTTLGQRLTVVVAMAPALDANYARVVGEVWPWQDD